MLSPAAIERAQETGLQAGDFYRESHGRIWNACLAPRPAGEPVDAITVTAKLRELGQLDDITGPAGSSGGEALIHEIAILTPAAGNVAHYARLVVAAARERQLIQIGLLVR